MFLLNTGDLLVMTAIKSASLLNQTACFGALRPEWSGHTYLIKYSQPPNRVVARTGQRLSSMLTPAPSLGIAWDDARCPRPEVPRAEDACG